VADAQGEYIHQEPVYRSSENSHFSISCDTFIAWFAQVQFELLL